jgi:alkyl sulfatase BDS1-like metallo-beta-lactamase superfamily hydrolase
MHNLLTPRGAKVRDAKAFGNAIDRAMEIYPNVEVLIGTHHWPTWGQDECKKILEKQRDMYYFFNNQVIHMLNSGYNMEEIAEKFTLPESLGNEFYNRGYYGTMNHDTKAVVQRYIGWWDGNPANYFKYPEEEVAKRFVNDMGGEDKVLSKARDYYSKHDYRWTVELTRNIVFANPENDEARKLEADALEQLAYSFEGGTWRNIFLAGAYELRGIPQGKSIDKGKIILSIGKNMESLTPKCIFEYLSILIDGNKASKQEVDMTCKIANESFSVYLKNGVLHSKAIADTNCNFEFGSAAEFADYFTKYMCGHSSTEYIKLNLIFKCVEIQNPQWNIIEPLS